MFKKIKEHFPGTNFINTKQIHKLLWMLNKYLVNKLKTQYLQPALVQHFKDIKLDSFMCSVERMCSLNNS